MAENRKPDDPEQLKRFKKTAQELELEGTSEAMSRAMEAITSKPKAPEKKRKSPRKQSC